MRRLPAVVEEPAGLLYRAEFVSENEERTLLVVCEGLDFGEVRMHGQAARRTVAHFGRRYGYESWDLTAAGEGAPQPARTRSARPG